MVLEPHVGLESVSSFTSHCPLQGCHYTGLQCLSHSTFLSTAVESLEVLLKFIFCSILQIHSG